MVLFGLMLVNLGPFKIFPVIRPPISEAMQPESKINKIILRWISPEKKKNKEQKIKMNKIKVIFWINFNILFLVIFSVILKNSIEKSH